MTDLYEDKAWEGWPSSGTPINAPALNDLEARIKAGVEAAAGEGGGGGEGPPGPSAYEVAVDNGFIGTEEEWLASLKGEPGDDGGLPDPSEADEGDVLTVGESAEVLWLPPTGGGGSSPGEWKTIAADSANGWENDWDDGSTLDPSLAEARFRLEGEDLVRLEGIAAGGSATGQALCELPAEFTPGATRVIPVLVTADVVEWTLAPLIVQPNGEVFYQNGTPYPVLLSFDGVTFTL